MNQYHSAGRPLLGHYVTYAITKLMEVVRVRFRFRFRNLGACECLFQSRVHLAYFGLLLQRFRNNLF